MDLLTEAAYSTRIRSNPAQGPDLITFVWGGITIGGVVAILLVGPVLEYFGVRALYAMCAVPAAIVLVPTCQNFLGEKKKNYAEVQVHRARLLAQPELVVLICIIGVGTTAMAIFAFLGTSLFLNMCMAVFVGVVIACSVLLLTTPLIGLMVTFSMIQGMLSITIEGGAFYFFTNNAEAYPEGPHFSKVFYTTGMGTAATVFSLLGMWAYSMWLKDFRYRPLYIVGGICTIAIHACGVLVFTRYNLVLGIPDEVFMMGTVMIQALVTQPLWLPTMVMMSHMCPKNLEATMFALVAGCSNVGYGIASFIGAYILYALDVTPTGAPGESAKFDNLWIAALISAFAPTVTIFLVPFMVPDATQTETLLREGASACDGSPWQRWMGKGDLGEAQSLRSEDNPQAPA